MLRCRVAVVFYICVAAVFAANIPALVAHVGPRKACAQDNCYNAFTHSLSIASPFCSTYIQSTTTVTAGAVGVTTVPPQVTNAQLSSRCNLDTNAAGQLKTALSLRLSSACSCISVAPRTVTVTVPAPVTVNPLASCQELAAKPQAYNGYYFAALNGNYFQIHCGFTIFGEQAGQASRTDLTFQGCIDTCEAAQGCLAISYVYSPSANTFTCNYISSFAFVGTPDPNVSSANPAG